MNARTPSIALALAGALALTACGAGPQPGTTPSPTSSAAASSPPSSAPVGTTPSATSSTKDATGAPVLALSTFTFPDGHLAFRHPGTWRVAVSDGPRLPDQAWDSKVATVKDTAEKTVAVVHSGAYGDGAAGPVVRTVLDTAPVPGLFAKDGAQVHYVFYVDAVGGADHYTMALDSRALPEGSTLTSVNQILMPNGVLMARAVFDDAAGPAFASHDEARAWLAGQRGQELKALLLSVTYQ